MNTKHVPTLELCQELDRLCKEKKIVVPETEFYWYAHRRMEDLTLIKWKIKESRCGSKESVPAPLVSEQGEWLPRKYKTMYFDTIREAGKWRMTYTDHIKKEYFEMFEATTEANARMKMTNYLIAEGIITKL